MTWERTSYGMAGSPGSLADEGQQQRPQLALAGEPAPVAAGLPARLPAGQQAGDFLFQAVSVGDLDGRVMFQQQPGDVFEIFHVRAEDDRLARRIGQKITTAGAMLGLARLAVDTGEWHRAATLHGAAQGLVDQTGFVWDPDEAYLRQESLDQIAAALGDEQLRQAYTRGTALTFDHAVDLALRTSSPP